MAEHEPQAIGHPDPKHHVVGKGTYYFIFGSLMVLTGVTTGVAYIDLGLLNTPVAMAIATLKMTLVILYFMHLRYSTRLTWAVALSAFFFLIVLFALTFTDYFSRGWVYPGSGTIGGQGVMTSPHTAPHQP
jgi:cytochrome c oxidase subunit 4